MSQTMPSERRPVRVLIAEDYVVFRDVLRSLLAVYPDEVVVVDESGNLEETCQQVAAHRPDVVLFDLQMPERPGSLHKPQWDAGVATIRRLAAETPETRILVLSNWKEPVVVVSALSAGADGYIAKMDEFEGWPLLDAIQRVVRGDLVYGPSITHILRACNFRIEDAPSLDALTAREREVLGRLLRGEANREIAAALVIELPTVKTHVRNILSKLGLRSREEIPWHMGARSQAQ